MAESHCDVCGKGLGCCVPDGQVARHRDCDRASEPDQSLTHQLLRRIEDLEKGKVSRMYAALLTTCVDKLDDRVTRLESEVTRG